MHPAGSKPRHIGEIAEAVVQSIDWTHRRPGDNFCPACKAGLGSADHCHWCGWPDPEAARARVQNMVKNAPERETDPLRRVVMKCRAFLADETEGSEQVAALIREIDTAL